MNANQCALTYGYYYKNRYRLQSIPNKNSLMPRKGATNFPERVRRSPSVMTALFRFGSSPFTLIFQPKNKKIAEILTTMQFLSIFTETQTIQFFFLLLLFRCHVECNIVSWLSPFNTTRWQNAMHSISIWFFSIRLSAPPREKWAKKSKQNYICLCGVPITFNIFFLFSLFVRRKRLPNRTVKNFFFCFRRKFSYILFRERVSIANGELYCIFLFDSGFKLHKPSQIQSNSTCAPVFFVGSFGDGCKEYIWQSGWDLIRHIQHQGQSRSTIFSVSVERCLTINSTRFQ